MVDIKKKYESSLQRARTLISYYKTVIVFLLIAVGFGFTGWIVLPKSASPTARGMEVRISADNRFSSQPSITSFSVIVNNNGGTGSVRLMLTTTPVKSRSVIELSVFLPSGSFWKDYCYILGLYGSGSSFRKAQNGGPRTKQIDKRRVITHGACYNVAVGLMYIEIPIRHDSSTGNYGGGVALGARGQPSNYNQQDNQIAGVLPQIYGLPADVNDVRVDYILRGDTESYIWQGRQPDYSLTGVYQGWDLSKDEIDGPPLAIFATNPAVQKVDGEKLFWAGAFVGIAGGAIIAVFQEYFDRRRNKSRKGVGDAL